VRLGADLLKRGPQVAVFIKVADDLVGNLAIASFQGRKFELPEKVILE